MKKAYHDPSLHISMFDDEDDIVVVSGTTAQSQAEDAIEQYSEGSGVSVYSVDVKTN